MVGKTLLLLSKQLKWQSWSKVVKNFTKIDLPQNINIQEVDNKLLPIVRNIKIKEILK